MTTEAAPGPRSKRLAGVTATADYIGISKSSLDRSRITGFIGRTPAPTHIVIGTRIIYDLDLIDRWLEANQRRTTSESIASSASAGA